MNKKLIATKVAKYWTDFLRDPSTSKFDNGDSSSNGAMAMMLSKLGQPSGYSDSEIGCFESQMVANLLLDLPSSLNVDYSPCCFIGDIADEKLGSWSSMSTFPCKTNMRIDWESGEVKVSEGYAADFIQI